MTELRKPLRTDSMNDHAEQHSLVVDEFEKLHDIINNHDHPYASDSHTHPEYEGGSGAAYDDTQVKEDIKANADAIAEIQTKGYDDTELRGLISDEETARVEGDKDLQDQINVINTQGYDDSEVRDLIQGNADAIAEIQTKGYDDTGVKLDIQTNADNIAANAKAIEEIVVPDVSDFVTSEELSTGLSGKADDTHTHDAPDLTHDHSGVYSEEGHTHDEYLTDLTHDHEGVYQPLGDYATNDALTNALADKADADHTHDEFDDLDSKIKTEADKNAEQDQRLAALEAEDDDATSNFDNAYAPGDPENEGEYGTGVSMFAGWAKDGNIYEHYSANSDVEAIAQFKRAHPLPNEQYGGYHTEDELCDPKGLTFTRWVAEVFYFSAGMKTYNIDYAAYGDAAYLFNEVDANGEDFVGPPDGEPWVVTCDDGPIQRFIGATAGEKLDNKVAVTLSDGDALSGSVKLGVVDPVPQEVIDEFAKLWEKIDDLQQQIIDLQ